MIFDTQRLATDPDYWRECGAPEDAEGAIDNGWIKKTKRAHKTWSWMPFTSSETFSAGEWYPTGSDFDESPSCKVIPRPKTASEEWVDGLPPLHKASEVDHERMGSYIPCFVHGYKIDKSDGIKVVYEILEGEFTGVIDAEPAGMFRPIPTKQERQRDELKEVIRRAYLEGASTHIGGIEAAADAIIADGWTKP